MAEFNPTAVEVLKAEIISFDGLSRRDISGNYIYGFEITQSMDAVAYSGSINVLDTSSILESMPIRGEETLYFWIKGMDLQTEVKIAAVIHKVTDIHILANNSGLTYKLHFVSLASFNASTRKVITSFAQMTPDAMAKSLFTNNYAKVKPGTTVDPHDENKSLPYQGVSYSIIKSGDSQQANNEPDRNIVIMNTINKTKLIIPDLSASESMFFVAARAYNPASPSQTFRFFETLESYYFCTDEYFIKKANNNTSRILDMFYAPVVDLTPQNVEAQVERIDELHILSKGVDSSGDINSGAYTNEVLEIDFIKRKVDISKFNYDDAKYIDMSGKPRTFEDNPHTKEYRDSTFTAANARRFMVFKHYGSPGDAPGELLPDQHLSEITHNRVSYFHHLNATSLMAVMKGRLDLRPGMLINLSIKNMDGVAANVEDNRTLSGRYMIQQTVHTMDEGTLTTAFRLVKFDWSGRTKNNTVTTDIPIAGAR